MFYLMTVIWFAYSAPLSPAIWKEKAEDTIKKEIQGISAKENEFGIWIKKGDQVASLNGNQLFIPASLSKIPTALTFLDQTTMDQNFKTWVLHTGKIEKGVLKGDLYLKGGGDPTFVSESMWVLANRLKRDDIKVIDGNLYVDETYFDSDYYSEGRQQKRVDRAYDAPVSGLSFNWNSISIYVRPGDGVGDPAKVYTDPELANIEIKNKATTSRGGKISVAVERKLKDGKIIISLKGSIPKDHDEKAFYKSIGDAAIWTGQTFKQILNKAGIRYEGDVSKKVTPKEAQLLVEHEGWGVPRVMAALSKFSNNFVAEMITKHLGKTEGVPASIDDGLLKITEFLKKKGWKSDQFEFVNPSGFTKENKLRADLLGELLDSARTDFDSAPEFMASLPISGIDGTLKSRMQQVMRGKVRAKTGYLTGIVGLAGYMDTQGGGEPITFVFMYNGPYKKDWDVRAMFGRLLWRIYQKS